MNRDLTVGQPSRVLWNFCLPLFGSVIFQQLYNIADSFVAGKYIGAHALAAVGNSYEISLIFIAFAFGCNIATSIVVAQSFGRKEYIELKTAISTSYIATASLCMSLMLLGYFLSNHLLQWINTPQELMKDSLSYLMIYITSLPFVFFYNLNTGMFSAMGDSRTPFIFLVCSSLANIFMDVYFVTVLGRGVQGLAEATLICQGIACILSGVFIYKRLGELPRQNVKGPRFSRTILNQLLKIAVPTIMQQSFISLGNIVIQGVINSFGTQVIAGYAAAVKLNNLVITSLTTLGNGISTYSAQNVGAGQIGRVKKGFKAGWKMVWLICLPIFFLYFFMGDRLMLIFMKDKSGQALESGYLFLKILSPFYFLVSLKLVADGVLKGLTLMKEFMVATFVGLSIRVLLTVLLSRTPLGSTGIWLSWPLGWLFATSISLYFYRTIDWGHLKLK